MRTSQAHRTREHELDNLILLNGTAREYYPLDKPPHRASTLLSMVFGMLLFVSTCGFIGSFAVSIAGLDFWNTAVLFAGATGILLILFAVFYESSRP